MRRALSHRPSALCLLLNVSACLQGSCHSQQSLVPGEMGSPGDKRGHCRKATQPTLTRSSRGGVGDLLYPAYVLVGCGHVAVDETTKLGPGFLRLCREVIDKLLGDHLQNDPRENLGAKEGRWNKCLGTQPPTVPRIPARITLLCVTQTNSLVVTGDHALRTRTALDWSHLSLPLGCPSGHSLSRGPG